MKNYFHRILVPVNLSGDTSGILTKSVEIANELGCDLHLLYVQVPSIIFPFIQPGYISSHTFSGYFRKSEKKMDELVMECRAGLTDGLLVNSSVRAGQWQGILKETIITQHIDLLLIPGLSTKGQDPGFRKVDVNQLSQQTQCPVLTLTSDFALDHLQNIVVPVNDFLPLRKLTAATFLAKKYDAKVHLLGQRSTGGDKQHTMTLTMAYQLLSGYTDVKIHCASEKGSTMASDALAYAREVKADLIVVNPGKESLLNGFFNRWLSRYLHFESNIPVLTISRRP